MDFLDPDKKRSQMIKLNIGHFLMVVLVLVGTFILVFQAYGFDLDRDTGEVIQNGLVFVDSAPDGAEIKINGQVQKDITNTRLALPEGKYDLEINKNGYRTWKKSFELKGGSIERFTYPTLFPVSLVSSELQTFDAAPGLLTQSPDRRWVLIGHKNNLRDFTLYDLNTLQSEAPVSQKISLPTNLFSNSSSKSHSLEAIEWSTDNENVLALHKWKGGQEFVVINHDDPGKSFNLSSLLDKKPTKVMLRDKKIEEFYLYSAKDKSLSSFNVANRQTTVVAENVITFAPHGEDIMVMAIAPHGNIKKTQIIVRDGEKTYLVRELGVKSNIRLAIARYDGEWYIAVHDPAHNETHIYNDPMKFVAGHPGQKPVPVMVLHSIGAVSEVTFSQNTRFIAAHSGQHFSVYDIEHEESFRYQIKKAFDKNSEVLWMDGHRMIGHSGGENIVFEYDGQNQQTLGSSLSSLPVVFNRDYTELYALQSAEDKKPVFTQTFLRLEEDR